MNAERAMVDTNLLVYAHDPTDAHKHQLSRALLSRLSANGALVLSAQAINEFYAAATRPKRPPSLSHDVATSVITGFIASATVVPVTQEVTLRALKGISDYQLSFWDALIWAAAREHGITRLYTEDSPGTNIIEGVQYINPFHIAP